MRAKPGAEPPSERFDALLHAKDPEAICALHGAPYCAIVSDRQGKFFVGGNRASTSYQIDRHAVRTRMTRNIGERFLHQAKDGDIDRFANGNGIRRWRPKIEPNVGHAAPPFVDAV